MNNIRQNDSLAGAKTHENALFLYKSNQADALLRGRFVDYAIMGAFLGFVTGYNNLLILPLGYGLLQLPRKYALMQYFTFHAELLPHTE
jgi:hypothetical protein